MDAERLKDLLYGFENNLLSVDELEELFSYFSWQKFEQEIYHSMEQAWMQNQINDPDIKINRDRIYRRTIATIHSSALSSKSSQSKTKILKFVKIAAAAMLIFGVGLYFMMLNAPDKGQPYDIGPGSNRAKLILSNGKVFELDRARNGLVTQQASTIITKSATGKLIYRSITNGESPKIGLVNFNTLQTPAGGQYELMLPDGTKVWLNASSSLKFPSSFSSSKERRVELTGEAYFEVAHDRNMPFKVITGQQEITVLGTHFNVSAYGDEPFYKTTLLEGGVKIIKPGMRAIILNPGEQAKVGGKVTVERVDTEQAVAWKNGEFMLNDEDFRTTMRKISRWYNVEVIYDPSAPNDLELGGWVSRKKNISTVLHLMEATGKVHFKIDGRRITVTK